MNREGLRLKCQDALRELKDIKGMLLGDADRYEQELLVIQQCEEMLKLISPDVK